MRRARDHASGRARAREGLRRACAKSSPCQNRDAEMLREPMGGKAIAGGRNLKRPSKVVRDAIGAEAVAGPIH